MHIGTSKQQKQQQKEKKYSQSHRCTINCQNRGGDGGVASGREVDGTEKMKTRTVNGAFWGYLNDILELQTDNYMFGFAFKPSGEP